MPWILLALMLSPAPALASDPSPPSVDVSPSDAAQIQRLIDDQLQAFQRDDAQGAWKHVAPSLRSKFGSADNFLRMVRESYQPVYRPQSVHFDELALLPHGDLGQWLDVTGPDGKPYRALYLLERQADGSWRTSGCLLFEPGPSEPSV